MSGDSQTNQNILKRFKEFLENSKYSGETVLSEFLRNF